MKGYNFFALTSQGNVRSNNEDNFFCNGVYKKDIETNEFMYEGNVDFDKELVCAIFDGMGGCTYGERASLVAAQVLEEYFYQEDFSGEKAIFLMNAKLCSYMQEHSISMGSTGTILYSKGGSVQVTNVGDSRAYIYRDQKLLQLSTDHTEENSLLKIQKELGLDSITIESGAKNILTQHLGIEEDEFLLEPAISEKIKVCPEDIFLLCSDGLSGMVSEQDIINILSDKSKDIQNKGMLLRDKALIAGGKDNITLILVEYETEVL